MQYVVYTDPIHKGLVTIKCERHELYDTVARIMKIGVKKEDLIVFDEKYGTNDIAKEKYAFIVRDDAGHWMAAVCQDGLVRNNFCWEDDDWKKTIAYIDEFLGEDGNKYSYTLPFIDNFQNMFIVKEYYDNVPIEAFEKYRVNVGNNAGRYGFVFECPGYWSMIMYEDGHPYNMISNCDGSGLGWSDALHVFYDEFLRPGDRWRHYVAFDKKPFMKIELNKLTNDDLDVGNMLKLDTLAKHLDE